MAKIISLLVLLIIAIWDAIVFYCTITLVKDGIKFVGKVVSRLYRCYEKHRLRKLTEKQN